MPPRKRRSQPSRAPPAPTSAPAGVAEVRVPDIGDFKDVPIIEVMVKPGDTVKPEQPLVTLESDKASMEVPSPLGGVVQDLKVKVGDRVSEGTVILTLRTGRRARRKRSLQHRPRPLRRRNPRRLPSRATAGRAGARREAAFDIPYAGPSVRKLARERGVDLASGEGQRTARPHPAGGRRQFRQGSGRSRRGSRARQRRGGRSRSRPAAVAEGRFRQVRAGRDQAAVRASRRSPAPTCTATG